MQRDGAEEGKVAKWTRQAKGEGAACPKCGKSMHTRFTRDGAEGVCGRCFREDFNHDEDHIETLPPPAERGEQP